MKSKFEEFVAEKRAVSPVIGVVLMVAVVVILAAVIGAFVLGLGGDQQQTPQASFSYDAASGTLTHDGGDAINSDYLYTVADGGERSNWDGDATGENGGVVAGNSDTVDASETIRVIYDDGSGNSATIATINLGGGGGE